ncbi:MAG TPA: hypothetical protein VFV17_03145 [Usitatibacteraceae bacterium]|nr:hypothetical protein [Usitatibacteraceae bacterium]
MSQPEPLSGASREHDSEIDAMTLAELTRALLPYLGPYSITTVKRASRATSDPEEAIRIVAQHIDDAAKREHFLRSARRVLATLADEAHAKVAPPVNVAHNTGGRPPTPLTPELMRRGEVALAPIIGPLATVLVGRYAQVADNSRDFFERLASHLRNVEEREAFFARVREH